MIKDLIRNISLLDKDEIDFLCEKTGNKYSFFWKNKKNGTKRKIYHPAKELKIVQNVLNDFVISKFPVHSSCMAYRKNSSIKLNAMKHLGNNYVLRMDFKSFFDSISSDDVSFFINSEVYKYFKDWEEADTDIFTKLVCRKNSLVMGAVTSPALTNAMCFDLDDELFKYCESINVIYTRYADDLYFSTNEKNILKDVERKVFSTIKKLQCPKNLKINIEKTFHSSQKRKVIITGLVITNDKKISLGRAKKREFKSLVFKWNDLDDEKKSYVSGYLSYIKFIEPNFINTLCMKYGSDIVDEIFSFKKKSS